MDGMNGFRDECGNGQWMIDQGVVILLSYLARSVLLFCWEGFVVLRIVSNLACLAGSREFRAAPVLWLVFGEAHCYVQCGLMAIYRRSPTCHSALRFFSPRAKPMSKL